MVRKTSKRTQHYSQMFGEPGTRAHHLLQLPVLCFRRPSPTLSLLRESLSRLLLVHHRFLHMFHHRFLGLMRHPHIMIMFQRRHLLRWRPGFIPICWCRRVVHMLCTPRVPSRSARQRRFTSLRPRPTGRNFLVRYIFIVQLFYNKNK